MEKRLEIDLKKFSNLENIDFSKYTFYTKEEIEEVLFNEEIYEIAWEIKNNFEKGIKNEDLYKSLEKKDKNFIENLFLFLIKNGLPNIKKFKEKFNLDSSSISVDIFYEGFVNRENGLNFEDNLDDFILMCEDKNTLLKKILLSGNIDFVYDFIDYNNFLFDKTLLDEEDINSFLYNFKKELNSRDLLQKINFISSYDWELVCETLFKNYEEIYRKIENLFNFTEEEKDEIENLKQEYLFTSYQSNREEIIKKYEQEDFSQIGEYNFFDVVGDNVGNNFFNKLNEIIQSLNFASEYCIKFIDIGGKISTFNIGNNLENLGGYNFNLFEKNDFYFYIREEYGKFKLNLEKNNMDFSILILKKNGIRDDNPLEEENNFLLAA